VDPNLSTSQIFYLTETSIQNISMYKKIHNVISNKFNVLSCYKEHGIMIVYDETICLSNTTLIKKYA
jgi:hypothetical protein